MRLAIATTGPRISASPAHGWQPFRWKGKGMNAIELKQRRAAMGWTQDRTAHALGVGLRHYQKLEAGHSPITPSLSKLIALVLFKQLEAA